MDYKTLEPKQTPLTLSVSQEAFANEWKKCISDKSSDLSEIMIMIEPFLKIWEKQLKNIFNPNIHFLTLCKLLSKKDINIAVNMVKDWVSWVETDSTIEHELKYLFIERLRNFKYKPALARPHSVEYIVAKDFKLALRNYIRTICRLVKKDVIYSAVYQEYETLHTVENPDVLLIKNLKLDNWQSYLLQLYKQGLSSSGRAQKLHIHRRDLYKEEKQLWDLLREKH